MLNEISPNTGFSRLKLLVKWQSPMVRVVYALAPAMLGAVYFFGWRFLLLLLVVNIAGFASEFAFCRYYREPVSSAIFVTNCLFAMILPPTLPFWMAAIGIVFGVVFGKMVFGGFGKNVFNPALVGRVFLYINFGAPMAARWTAPLNGFPGGFAEYAADAVTGATPLAAMADGGQVRVADLLFGSIAGCYGETSAILLALGGVYLLWTKTANRQIVASCFLGGLLAQVVFHFAGVAGAASPAALLGGGFVLGAFFMATDPVSACQTNEGRWLYGGTIGVLTVVIRIFSIWPEGMMFAVLLANMFGPITDHVVREIKNRGKGVAA